MSGFLCLELGAELCAESIKPVPSSSPAWSLAEESPCSQASEPGQWDMGTSWWETWMLRCVRLCWHITLGGVFVQIYNANFAGSWGICLILGKEIKHEPGGCIKCELKVLLVKE